ncbi:GLUT4 regulating protein TUG-domain-containing protein [Pseudomassariella vexata]|uniref:GLUT4 regulating protein TUG-domain-containing protein n=1 Tax=Pseudomassariella vexata TaxID=1141098 RepID=A0A1Y2E569_9PEZI|nr:GLUT4 regulating protein TUG-domain-containing protein [Pseudomassariella vexata]ORY66436.1 GLUT4 regulating protein TUG-domain-containing protein [Pseudomassariella vexata]
MATNVKVVSTDLRTTTVKVTPATYLTEILDKACAKWGLQSDRYLLKHNNKQLDLSNTFRNAGLVPGAKLELITKSKSPSVLSIALALPEREASSFGNQRAVEKLPSDYTIWSVLRYFEAQTFQGKNINITGRGVPQISNGQGPGQLYYETPVLQIEQRSFSTFVDFQKTLSSLGYNSGSVLIRLSFKKTERTLVEAMEYITQYFQGEKEQEKETTARAAERAQPSTSNAESKGITLKADGPAEVDGEPAPQPEAAPTEQVQAEPGAMDVDSAPTGNPLVPVSIFSAPSASTPAAARINEPDEVYEPGLAQLTSRQQFLKTAAQNKRLPSDKEIAEKAAAEAARLDAIKSVDVKVRFPDNTSAQWQFDQSATGELLHRAVRNVMAAQQAPFKLILPGPQHVAIRDDSANLIRTYNLTIRTLVNLVWDDSVPDAARKQPFLRQSAAQRAQAIIVPEVPQVEENEPTPAVPQRSDEPRRDVGSKGTPKWLKGLPGLRNK